MNIEVEIRDSKDSKEIKNQCFDLTMPAFVKHLAIAGQGYAPKPQKLIRTLAMFLHYRSYIQRHSFDNNKFSEPPIQLSDPTEKGQFSNLAGKAIADFLSKRIGNSTFTVNYEAAMRMNKPRIPISGSRPDLLAFAPNNQKFAIEAKGFSKKFVNDDEMNNYITQSQAGKINVDYTVACVSYNLYDKIKCKYYDPENDDKSTDKELLKKLSQQYYSGLLEFLNEKYFRFDTIEIQNETFYKVQVSHRLLEKYFLEDFRHNCYCHPHCFFECMEHSRISLLLPKKIKEFATNGITNDIQPFIFDTQDNKYTYIDNDRIGLQMKQLKY
jgi:hypothetical protein